MAKQSGLGYSINVDDAGGTARDISNDVTDFNYAMPRAVEETTGVDKYAMERILTLADFSISLNGIFNNAANKSHDVLKTVPSTSVNRTTTLAITGPTSVTSTLANECLYSDYQVKRDNTGKLTWTAPGILADGNVPTWT
jgi:hypothetical protein